MESPCQTVTSFESWEPRATFCLVVTLFLVLKKINYCIVIIIEIGWTYPKSRICQDPFCVLHTWAWVQSYIFGVVYFLLYPVWLLLLLLVHHQKGRHIETIVVVLDFEHLSLTKHHYWPGIEMIRKASHLVNTWPYTDTHTCDLICET